MWVFAIPRQLLAYREVNGIGTMQRLQEHQGLSAIIDKTPLYTHYRHGQTHVNKRQHIQHAVFRA
jgi:hypothetical protein